MEQYPSMLITHNKPNQIINQDLHNLSFQERRNTLKIASPLKNINLSHNLNKGDLIKLKIQTTS